MKFSALAFLLLLLIGCGSSASSNSSSSLPPVLAGQSYSNAAITGTYSAEANIYGEPAVGTLVFDGNGNITGGQLTDATTCTYTASGTYSIQSDASGTASMTLTPQGSCANGPSALTFSPKIEAAQAGETVYFSETSGGNLSNPGADVLANGIATKQ